MSSVPEFPLELPVPVPKPRARYKRSGVSLQNSFDKDGSSGSASSSGRLSNVDPDVVLQGSSCTDGAFVPSLPSLPTLPSSPPPPTLPSSPPSPGPLAPAPPLRRPGSTSSPPMDPGDPDLSPPSSPPVGPGDPDLSPPSSPAPHPDPSPPSSPAPDPDLYVTAQPNWGDGSESSNEEDDSMAPPPDFTAPPPTFTAPPPPWPDEGKTGLQDSSSAAPVHAGPVLGLVPCREAPPPPVLRALSSTKPLKQKTPRAATIRVSRRKQKGSVAGQAEPVRRESVVSRSSWLDVWKGRKHNVVWASLDGQLMSLWKKRTDKFSDVVFHVSSITNIKKQEKRRFSVFFRKKHFEFMAHSDVVQQGWVASLLASRGLNPPPAPQQHGPLTMKDPRSRVYAAVSQHRLWIYHNREDFQLGVGMTYVSMDVASVRATGRHNFSLITPYRTFSFSADSSREQALWVSSLEEEIRSALSCSQVALQLWASPWNKVCADCGGANPEWASVNLLAVICEACAGVHRSLGIGISKVRSLKLDSKVWTDPLIQLFVLHGNRASREVWGHSVPAAEQILPDCSVGQRSEFIQAKYSRGRYRRVHPLASNQTLLNQRLCEVVCGPDIPESLSLLGSGARVRPRPGEAPGPAPGPGPAPLALAEQAGQALQTELLRHNEYTEYPAYHCEKLISGPASDPASSGEEELHGKLEEDRFLFSQENDAAACDVLDLREVTSVFDRSAGSNHEFEVVTLTDKLLCSADLRETLVAHLTHILKVVLPGPLEEAELGVLMGVARVSLREGGGVHHADVWAGLVRGGVILYCTDPQRHRERLALSPDALYKLSSETTIELQIDQRTLTLQFEGEHSCMSWFQLLAQVSVSSQRASVQPPCPAPGTVPPALQRCISHITLHGLKVEGLYRRCGVAPKVSRLVQALCRSPGSAPLESDEQGVLDAAAALKQYVRQEVALIPPEHRGQWVEAAAEPVEAVRLASYRKLLKQLPSDNRVTLNTLCGHFYIVQLYSGDNRMTSHNLATVIVPSLFQELALSPGLVRLTRELIIHHTLLFMGVHVEECEDLITVF